MDDDLKNYGVWVGAEQVGYCLNKNEADTLADKLENKYSRDDIAVEIDLYLFRR